MNKRFANAQYTPRTITFAKKQFVKKVSILIAARNESDNIITCLKSVAALSYPSENLQILIGDDASEDNTSALIQEFIQDKPYFELVKILPEASKLSGSLLKGKTNVLAQLAHKVKGDYLFFTDADIEVPTGWVENMLMHFKPNVGIVTGITTMKGGGLLGLMQGLEWLYYLSLMRLLSLFGFPVTAMGNNMAVTRKAYDAVGGYEKIGFSITEDYALFRAILAKGFRFVQLFDRRVLTLSKPIPTYSHLLIQRKRWMYGAMSLPWEQRIGLYVNTLFFPFIIVLGITAPKIALITLFLYVLWICAWLVSILNWLQQPQLFIGVPFFWLYHVFTNFAMLINYYVRKTTVWKGRQY
ncbi:glycosyltransferase [Runella sp.]|uniref:glycosyltransferase n=1 Tax=Runella sp. TaxID=1960881 RepID=UPI003D0D3D22